MQAVAQDVMPAHRLVSSRRLDLAVKHRFFRHLINGSDPEAECLYTWHINERSGARMQAGLATDKWKRSIAHYIGSAKALLNAMSRDGYDRKFPVPVDPNLELLGGAHRVACALALGIEAVPVTHELRLCWAPAWDAQWFRAHGLPLGDIQGLQADLDRLANILFLDEE